MHRGHLHILKKVVTRAGKRGLKSLLVSLSPHPLHFYNKEFAGYIITQEEKIRLLKRLGLDYFWIVKFNKKVAKMDGARFLQHVLRYFNVKNIIVAEDFKFGYRAGNTISDLKRICRKRGIAVEEIKKKKIKKRIISSSLIRRLIKEQNFKEAKLFLGRDYSVGSKVKKGGSIGKKYLNAPTVNLDVDNKVLPGRGVYITKTKHKKKIYESISNLGISPTFGKKKIGLESHILNFHKSIYKDFVQVFFIKKIRPERRFSTLKDLKDQIDKDKTIAEKFFSSCRFRILG